ncbi:MAG: hypothetical protein ACFFC1_12600 [Promethearchaeota archaeon]
MKTTKYFKCKRCGAVITAKSKPFACTSPNLMKVICGGKLRQITERRYYRLLNKYKT